MIMAMERKLISELIDEYKACTCLWRIKDADYKNKERKNEAYESLLRLIKKYTRNPGPFFVDPVVSAVYFRRVNTRPPNDDFRFVNALFVARHTRRPGGSAAAPNGRVGRSRWRHRSPRVPFDFRRTTFGIIVTVKVARRRRHIIYPKRL